MSIRLSDEAGAEVEKAASWYERQREGLGAEFLGEFHRTIEVVEERPRGFQRLASTSPDLEIRRALLSRFPYAIVFMVIEDQPRVLAVCHQHRKPGYWLYRIREEE